MLEKVEPNYIIYSLNYISSVNFNYSLLYLCKIKASTLRARSHTAIAIAIASTHLWVHSISNVLFIVCIGAKISALSVKVSVICINANTIVDTSAQYERTVCVHREN